MVRYGRIVFEEEIPNDATYKDALAILLKSIENAKSFLEEHDVEISESPYEKEESLDKEPVVSRSNIIIEELLGGWKAHIDDIDGHGERFNVFTEESGKLTVKDLEGIIEGGRDAFDLKVDELRDLNEEEEYQMFKDTFRGFLCIRGVDENIIGEEEKFREEFENHVHWNIEKLFDFPVLLMEKKRYGVYYNGISNGINCSIPEQKEFMDKVLKYMTKEEFDDILANSWRGSGFFGIIINGGDIIRSIREDKSIAYSDEMVIGIHDTFCGSGFFKMVNNHKSVGTKEGYGIDIKDAELDCGKYSLGEVFGNVKWEWS